MSRRRLIDWLSLLWMAGYTTLVFATGSLAQDVIGYDYKSLAFAAAAGLFGGAARTIYTMASDRIVVLSIWREFTRDAVVAVIGGVVTYVVIQGFNSYEWVSVPREMRMLLILGAGWSRGRWFGALNRLTANLVDNVMQKARGRAEPPSSASMPLEQR